MDITDIATEGYRYLDASPDERLGELRSVLESEGRCTILVVEDGPSDSITRRRGCTGR